MLAKNMIRKILLTTSLFLAFISAVKAGDTITIDNNSFGVIYESPMNSDKGLILFISNSNCVGNFRITNSSNSDFLIAQGEINTRGPAKLITLGLAKLRVDCGPQQSLTLMRE